MSSILDTLQQQSESTQTFRGETILDGDRFRILSRKQAYFECTQHDWKRFDFDGRTIQSRDSNPISATQPLLSGEKFGQYVPLRERRPSAPYRLPRAIVNAFTNMLFGEDRFPSWRVPGDTKSQDFVRAVGKSASLPVRMIRARRFGGAMGSVGVSWAYVNGKPRIRVHNAKYLYVHSWEDRDELIPRHVTECFRSPREEWDLQKNRLITNFYWHRRDWTKDCDIKFEPILVDGKNTAGRWIPDAKASTVHNDGLNHLVWLQNLPSEDIDGESDFEGLYENFDALDLILSVITRGASLNLDPTVVLKMDRDLLDRVGVKKGSEHALAVGEEGDAKYLELQGQGLLAGLELFNAKRKTVLEVAECVIPDSDKISASGLSSIAQKMLFSPMTSKSDTHRSQYGHGMARVLEPMLIVAQQSAKTTIIISDKNGNPQEAKLAIVLPPRYEEQPVLDDDDQPTGETKQIAIERDPGQATDVEAEWGPRFPPTPMDHFQEAQALGLMNGNQPVISQQTSSEIAANMFGRDANDEWRRLQAQSAASDAKTADLMSGDAGGAVSHTTQLPNGATVKHTANIPSADDQMPTTDDSSSDEGDISLAPADLSTIVTVNEARAAIKLPKIDGPEGELTIAAYKNKYADQVAGAANADLGKVGTTSANPPPPPNPFGHPAFGAPPTPFGGKPGEKPFPPKPGAFPPKNPGGNPFPPKPDDDDDEK